MESGVFNPVGTRPQARRSRSAAVLLEDGKGIASPFARMNRLSLASVLKVLALLVAALFAYLLIAAGSWEEMKKKLSAFFRREFADLLDFRRGAGGGGREDDHD